MCRATPLVPLLKSVLQVAVPPVPVAVQQAALLVLAPAGSVPVQVLPAVALRAAAVLVPLRRVVAAVVLAPLPAGEDVKWQTLMI